jgi:uncharacterized phage protein (TIGR02218 family)
VSYDAYESSVEGGAPIEIYTIAFGATAYRYTSYKIDVNILSEDFEAIPISRGTISQSVEQRSEGRLEVVVPGDNPFVQQFITAVPGIRATLTLQRYHRDDPAEEVVLIYKGTVQTVRFEKNGRRAVLIVVGLTAAKGRSVPRFTYQGLCNHMLYDGRCKVNSSLYQHTLYVVSVNGRVLTVSGAGAIGADYFENGFVEYNGDYRMVTAQGGVGNNDLTLLIPFSTSPVGQWLEFYAGCKHTPTVCDTKFANIVNYGGFPSVPTKNPFESGLE